MTEKKDVSARESGQAEGQGRESESILRPPVDIFEDAEGISLHADMPGVSKDGLNVEVDNDTLLVEGSASIEMPKGMEALYADVRSTLYRRSFALSRELDTDHIEARIQDGVLGLRIPKRAEVRPRKIDVQVS